MKMRIMGLLCAMVMLLTLLPGCSGAEAEPEAATVAATQVSVTESATEPAAEPTTEPATVPTKPPTIVEELGYELWDGAENITQFNSWNYRGAEMPVSARVNGSYRDIMMQFAIVGSDGKEYRALADTTVDIWMSEFPGSGFDDDIDWLEEKLTPFYEACKKRESSKLTYEEWIEANSDQKLIYVETAYRIKGTELYLKTIEDGVKMKDLRVGYTIPDIVDSMTGEVFFVKEKYDHQKPEVGCWQIDQDGDEVEIQAWYTCRYAWAVFSLDTRSSVGFPSSSASPSTMAWYVFVTLWALKHSIAASSAAADLAKRRQPVVSRSRRCTAQRSGFPICTRNSSSMLFRPTLSICEGLFATR